MKEKWIAQVDVYDGLSQELSAALWAQPEISGQEQHSAQLLRQCLSQRGFRIREVPGMANAFVAEYGSGSPVIGLLGEYDALPSMSQKACSSRDEVTPGGAGHGCGHNLLGVAALCAALAAKDRMEAEKLPGTIRFYGCPEEETLVGKVKMIKAGAFEGCDVALSWHPMSMNQVFEKSYLANNSIKFKFSGTAAHAGTSPHLGRSALDAVELMNVGANYLREHIIDKARMHYTTNSGGFLPNIVPPYADSWYYIRAPFRKDVIEITERLCDVARGAALMTGTSVEIEKISGCYEMRGNPTLSQIAYENLSQLGAPAFSAEDLAFGKELQATVSSAQLAGDLANASLSLGDNSILHQQVCSMEVSRHSSLTASSDSGDVSQIMPMSLFTVACWPQGIAPHSWQATASVGGAIGHKGSMLASRVLAGSIHDLLTQPQLVEQAKAQFAQQHRDDPYICPLD